MQCQDSGYPTESCVTEAQIIDSEQACSYIYILFSDAKAVSILVLFKYTLLNQFQY